MNTYSNGLKIGPLRFFGKQVIGADGLPVALLVRWILFRCPPFGIYLHKFCRSDYDKALHDHPWPFVSIILRGGYWEVHSQTRDGCTVKEWRKPGSVLLRPAEWRHRVVLEDGKTSWQLIIVGRRAKSWGFFLPTGWCWWRKYNYDLGICEDEILWTSGKG